MKQPRHCRNIRDNILCSHESHAHEIPVPPVIRHGDWRNRCVQGLPESLSRLEWLIHLTQPPEEPRDCQQQTQQRHCHLRRGIIVMVGEHKRDGPRQNSNKRSYQEHGAHLAADVFRD